jgi:uncharacterized RDD family membrane protein YckC
MEENNQAPSPVSTPRPIQMPGNAPVYTYAGFWWRFLAYLIDAVIIWVAYSIIAFILAIPMGFLFSTSTDLSNSGPSAFFGLLYFLFVIGLGAAMLIGYFPLFEASKYRGTPGKIVLGLVVGDELGNPINYQTALVRNLCKILSGIILDIGYIMAAFTEKKQALHDIIAKTNVYKKVQ